MKVLERVLDSIIRQMVDIGKIQFGIVPGRGTTDAIFHVRQLQEKYRAVNKPLYLLRRPRKSVRQGPQRRTLVGS